MENETDQPSPLAASQDHSPQARARRCSEIVQRVLAEHGCRAVAYVLPPEAIGDEKAGLIVRAAWGIIADPR